MRVEVISVCFQCTEAVKLIILTSKHVSGSFVLDIARSMTINLSIQLPDHKLFSTGVDVEE